jgi:hypothetical protein
MPREAFLGICQESRATGNYPYVTGGNSLGPRPIGVAHMVQFVVMLAVMGGMIVAAVLVAVRRTRRIRDSEEQLRLESGDDITA